SAVGRPRWSIDGSASCSRHLPLGAVGDVHGPDRSAVLSRRREGDLAIVRRPRRHVVFGGLRRELAELAATHVERPDVVGHKGYKGHKQDKRHKRLDAGDKACARHDVTCANERCRSPMLTHHATVAWRGAPTRTTRVAAASERKHRGTKKRRKTEKIGERSCRSATRAGYAGRRRRIAFASVTPFLCVAPFPPSPPW